MKTSDKVLVVSGIMLTLGIVFLIINLQFQLCLLWSILCIAVSAIGIVSVFVIRHKEKNRQKSQQRELSQAVRETKKTPNVVPTKEEQETALSLSPLEEISFVSHDQFGVGEIVESDGKYIKVRFSDAVRAFVYPDSFREGYLKRYDPATPPAPKVQPKPLPAGQPAQAQAEQKSARQNVLHRSAHREYGNRAREIYIQFGKEYGWDLAKSGCFAPQKPLFAEKATQEGYDVWFIANSNWTQTKGGVWSNTISANSKTIEERWTEARAGLHDLGRRRVVFAKVKGGGYVFLGIFQAERVEKYQSLKECTWKKIYRAVSSRYPQESGT